jgi:O-antigen/teichoic acid export membrane protein
LTHPSGQTSARGPAIAANTALRATTIGVRSALIVGLAVWFEPAELGVYGVVAATITLATYLFGLDFYTYTLRAISPAELGSVRYQLRDQFLLFCGIYLIGGLALAAILPEFGLDSTLAIFTAAIAVLQHAALELYRVLLRLERTMAASLCLFIRDAAWVPICSIAWFIRGELDLSDVLLFWLAGSLAAVGVAAMFLFHAAPPGTYRPVDPSWLGQGLKTGLRMLPGTLSLRGLFTVDRMILASIATPEILGPYVFFSALCGAATALFETGILPFFWPYLLETARRGERERQVAAQHALSRACLIGALGLAVASVVGGAVLAALLPHAAYREHLSLLIWIALAYLLVTLSNIPHYRLYAANCDLVIVLCNAAAFIVFLALAGILAFADVALAVPIALVSASALLLALKWESARRYCV